MVIGFDAKRAFNNNAGLGNYSRHIINSVNSLLPEYTTYLFTPKVASKFINYSREKNLITPKGLSRISPSLWREKFCINDILNLNLTVFHGLSNELPYGIEKTPVKKIVTIHDLIFKRHPEFYKNPFDVKAYDKKFSHACNVADKIIAISEQTKSDIIDFYGVSPDKITVIYQDCDPMFRKVCSDVELQRVKVKYSLPNKFILSTGTIEKRKNQESTVKALAELRDPSIHLVLIGKETAYQNKIIETAKKLHLEHRVRIINNANFLDFPQIYQQANCFVYISHFEGFGIPILEALNSKTPIITSKGSCLEEVGGNAALYSSPKDYKDLAHNISSLINNKEIKDSFIEKISLQAEKFRSEKTINQYKSIIN